MALKRGRTALMLGPCPVADRTLAQLNMQRPATSSLYKPVVDVPDGYQRASFFTSTLREITLAGRAPAGLDDKVRKSIMLGGFLTEEVDVEESKYLEIEPEAGATCFIEGCDECVYASATGSFHEPDPLLDRILGAEGGILCSVMGVSALAPDHISLRVCKAGHIVGSVAITVSSVDSVGSSGSGAAAGEGGAGAGASGGGSGTGAGSRSLHRGGLRGQLGKVRPKKLKKKESRAK
jgi:hypothetical protein